MSASGAVGDYTFIAHAVGSDANTITHDATLTLRLVDFDIGSVNPNPVTVSQGASASATFQVSASGSFALPVALNCSGLPSGASCAFQPSSTIHPMAGSPVTLTLTISTTTSIALGSATVTIQGATSAPAATRTSSFTLTVTAPTDFSWTATGGTSHTVRAGQTTPSYNFTAAPTSAATFAANVNLSCSFAPADSTLSDSTCAFNPATISAGAGTTQVSLLISTKGPNTGTGAAIPRRADRRPPWWPWLLPLTSAAVFGIIRRSRSKNLIVVLGCACMAAIGLMVACQSVSSNPPPPTGLTITPSSATVPLGGTKQFSASAAVTWSVSGSGLLGTIDGSGLYTAPATGSTPANATITAISQADTTKSASAPVTIPAVSVGLNPTPVSLYPNVAGATGWPPQGQQFTSLVSNATDAAVNWTVSSGGGTVDGSGLYTAPANVPHPSAVSVIATSQADSSKSGTATVHILVPTGLGTFTVTVTASEGSVSHSQTVTLIVQ